MNRINITGFLASMPNLSYTKTNKAVAEFVLEHSLGIEKTMTFKCIAWGETAQEIHKMRRGVLIGIDGKLQSRIYRDSNNYERISVEIVAMTIENYTRV